ncbi:MAG: polysaccharide biosynthesis/export family protein [Bacteroidales bacterium]|nr:polysaccharide biosynthesis/export family protein [Bacteroidales bacterium]
MKSLKIMFLFAMSAIMASSCVSTRNVRYLQDMQKLGAVDVDGKFEAKISPSDELRIYVLPNGDKEERELIEPFNIYNSGSGNGTNMTNARQSLGYLVDVEGNIQFPVLGKMKVAGLTCRNLRDTIEYRLKNEGYLTDPLVDVRITNFKIYFLGSNGGKAITIDNERCTFLEALSLAGDLNLYTKRSKIGVVREKDGKMVIHYMDPRSSDIFNDEFFLLQQNDIILTEAMSYVYFKEWMSNLGVVLTPITTLASVLAVVIAIRTSIGNLSNR